MEDSHQNVLDGEEAQQRLVEGNNRFASGDSTFLHLSLQRRQHTCDHGQHPFAIIVGCSDSRVPIELVFDQGIGDLFIVRVAGNVCAVNEIGSIEFGVEYLETPLVVILGHTHCGAVSAVARDDTLLGSLPKLAEHIVPAVERARGLAVNDDDLIDLAIRQNVWHAIEDLFAGSPACVRRAEAGHLRVVGALYDITSGAVQWLGPHPDQKRLLAGSAGETL